MSSSHGGLFECGGLLRKKYCLSGGLFEGERLFEDLR